MSTKRRVHIHILFFNWNKLNLVTILKMKPVAGFCSLLLIFILQQVHKANAAYQVVLPRYPRQHIAGVTFEALEVFQSYPVDRRNTDQTAKIFRSCDGLSGYRETIHAASSLIQNDKPSYLSKPCKSVLQNCRFDESMERHVSFCVSRDQHRRYDYMVINMDVNHVYGRNSEGVCPSSKFEYYFSSGAYYPCVCDCESSERQVDRYFSLLDVVSDNDKVVTGVRFRKIDRVIYIQIQQAKLGPNRTIDGKAEWKDLDTISMFDLLTADVSNYNEQDDIDEILLRFNKNDWVYVVTSEQNSVLLDDLEAGQNEVVTGLRLRQVGQDLGFQIQVTPFHDETGMLERNASRWLQNDDGKGKRKEIKMPHTNIPGGSESMNILSSGNHFVKFQVSDFKTDLGQTTVPLIDIRDVVPEKPRPVSGAGIFHRGSSDSAGFIALKMIL